MDTMGRQLSEQVRDYINAVFIIDAGLTQRQASEKVGIDPGTFNRFIHDKGRAKGTTFSRISLQKLDDMIKKSGLRLIQNGKGIVKGFRWRHMALGDLIREAVTKSGLKPYQICKKAKPEIDQPMFWRFMRGKANKVGMSLRTLDALADVLELTIERSKWTRSQSEKREKPIRNPKPKKPTLIFMDIDTLENLASRRTYR